MAWRLPYGAGSLGVGGIVVALDSFFLNPGGLTTAIVLLPFLLLYLIRPKPLRERIPSLLFIMKDLGQSNVNSLFRTLFKDLLILFQLLILLALIGAAAQPYINVPKSYLVKQTVLLVDVSGSMHANGDARFKEAISLAEKNLGGRTPSSSSRPTPKSLRSVSLPGRRKTS